MPGTRRILSFASACALVLGGCALSEESTDTTVIEPTAVPTTVAAIETASTEPSPSIPTTPVEVTPAIAETPPDSIAGLTFGETPVFERIGDPEPFRILPETTILGTPTVVSVLDEFEGWVYALLPGRPNGDTGWIRASDVEIFTLDREVLVDLDERTLIVMSKGEDVFSSRVAVGSEVSPTPTGSFFVTDAVQLTSPNGPWGPYAFGLSARSDVVTEFNGGDGIVGIHGTNQPWSIGEAASLGCVRLPNDVIEILWDIMAVGMKVTITGSG